MVLDFLLTRSFFFLMGSFDSVQFSLGLHIGLACFFLDFGYFAFELTLHRRERVLIAYCVVRLYLVD